MWPYRLYTGEVRVAEPDTAFLSTNGDITPSPYKEDTVSLPRVPVLHADPLAIFPAVHTQRAVESLYTL